MKLRTLSSAALVAALTVGALSPMTAFADATELDSTGNVIVEEGGDEQIPGTVDPEDPDEILPEPDPDGPDENTNPDLGALMIEKTTDLDFGTIKTSANEVTAYALPMSFGGGTETRGAYVQWRDIRSASSFGYTISAKMTQQFTGTDASNVLTSSTVSYNNGMAVAQGDNTNAVPSNVSSAFTLQLNVASTVVTADKDAQEGKGRYIIEFGQSETSTTGTPGTDAESVLLTVPAATASNMAEDTYTAKITWSIVAAA
ncbi:WxL domain-containing protein [Enterococcus larvae]|uniref:WxL domain-containing protein n=1 Tax=Enterococcus larvae TaxID=2794352 RepID=UPI003F31A5FA